MSNNFFRFKQFTVYQDICAMKVGTDGTLLGAWAAGGERILDIGTGTGLIALMMAQRFPNAIITAIDIDEKACQQAEANFTDSPFAMRISTICASLQDYEKSCKEETYDAIVCNPPFFVNSLLCPDDQRATARHASKLKYQELFHGVQRLLTDKGIFSAIIPTNCLPDFEEAAYLCGLNRIKKCSIKTVPRKEAKRVLMSYSKSSEFEYYASEESIDDGKGNRTKWYSDITSEFYL